jgi:hypothetical protein
MRAQLSNVTQEERVMRQPKGFTEYGHHGCCPDIYNHTPDMTGDHIMDGSIMRCKNKDAQAKLTDHLTTDVAYKRNTSYNRTSI